MGRKKEGNEVAHKWNMKFTGNRHRQIVHVENLIKEIFRYAETNGLTNKKDVWRENSYATNQALILTYFRHVVDVVIPALRIKKEQELHEKATRYEWTARRLEKELTKMHKQLDKVHHPFYWKKEWYETFFGDRVDGHEMGKRGCAAGTLKKMAASTDGFMKFYQAFPGVNGRCDLVNSTYLLELLCAKEIIRSKDFLRGIRATPKQLEEIRKHLPESIHKKEIKDILYLQGKAALRIGSVFRLKVKDMRLAPAKNDMGYMAVLDVLDDKGNKDRRVLLDEAAYQFLLKKCKGKKQEDVIFRLNGRDGKTISLDRSCKIVAKAVKDTSDLLGYTQMVEKTGKQKTVIGKKQVSDEVKKKAGEIKEKTKMIEVALTNHSFRKGAAKGIVARFDKFKEYENGFDVQKKLLFELVNLQPSKEQVLYRFNQELNDMNKYRKKKNKEIKEWNTMYPTNPKPKMKLYTLDDLIRKRGALLYASVYLGHVRSSIVTDAYI